MIDGNKRLLFDRGSRNPGCCRIGNPRGSYRSFDVVYWIGVKPEAIVRRLTLDLQPAVVMGQ